MSILRADQLNADLSFSVVVIGAGACGQVAALAVRDAGCDVLVLERDSLPRGSTALSSGMIPACGTSLQRAKGVEDTPAIMAADIQRKARMQADPVIVEAAVRESGPAIDWLVSGHGLNLTLVEGFLYPGHSRLRMHAPPSRTGADLMGDLGRASAAAGVTMLCDATVTDLFADSDGRIIGVGYGRPDGTVEQVGCGALVLACNGFGGNRDMVGQLIPEMADANYFGHPGNRGDAIVWGRDLGAALGDLGAYQGHGSVAHPHGILISWALMMEGGIQVNRLGARFSNEHEGYSEQGRKVMAQPDGVAWNIFDTRLRDLGREFEDFRQAEAAGAVRRADSVEALASLCEVPAEALTATLDQCAALAAGEGRDPFGRDFAGKPALAPPYFAVRVTGSLFHTQGGLQVDGNARVLRPDGLPLPNLLAGGGAARGVSGPADWGYLSGNGLLSAVALGCLAGRNAVRLARQQGR